MRGALGRIGRGAGADLAALLVGLALGVLLATALRALLSTLFYLSLVTLRLNATSLWTLVLLAPLAARVARIPAWTGLAAGVAVAALPWLRFTDAFVPAAALAAGAALLALTRVGAAAWLGATLGLALGGALLLFGTSVDILMEPWAGPLALGLGIAALLFAREGSDARPDAAAGVAWAALLAAELAFLASPYALARQTGLAPWLAAGASATGLVAGVLLARRARAWSAGLALLALLDVALVRGPLVVVSVFVLQAALGAGAARLARPHPVALGLTLAPVAFALLFFSQTWGRAEWGLALPILCAPAFVALAASRGRPLQLPRRVAAPFLVLVLLPLPLLAPVPDVRPHEGDVLTVVTWNVHQGFGNRGALDPHLYAEALRAIEPDIVLLQEVDTTRLSSGGFDAARFLARELGLHEVSGGTGVAVLSRFPAATQEPSVSQGWSDAVALDVHGRVVWAESVHLARSRDERAVQVSEILAAANATAGPRILGGDVNSCPTDTCFGGRPSDGVHEKLGLVFQDAWAAHHPADDPQGNTHPARAPARRIDVVMVRGLEVLEAGPLRDERTVLGSDHLPVVARLRLT